MAGFVERLDHKPVAFGANCGVGSSDLLRTVLGFAASGTNRPVIAKGNAGIPKYSGGCILYDGTPDLMAQYAVMARDSGARIIGGCCGTTAVHLQAMRRALEDAPRGAMPTLDVIASELGGFSSESDGTDAATPARRPGASVGAGTSGVAAKWRRSYT